MKRKVGLRAVLNLGHTIGHAVESASNFKLLHGECISIGIMGAFTLANHLNLVDRSEMIRVADILSRACATNML